MAFENLKNLWQVVEQAIGRSISSQTGRETTLWSLAEF